MAASSCRAISQTNHVYNIQPQYLPSGYQPKDRVLLDHLGANTVLHYDATEFPSFCGISATFSMWVENWDNDAHSTLIARYPDGLSKRSPGSWFYQIDQSPGGTQICIGQIPDPTAVAFWKCVTPPVQLNGMKAMTRRHLALVLNHETTAVQFYCTSTAN